MKAQSRPTSPIRYASPPRHAPDYRYVSSSAVVCLQSRRLVSMPPGFGQPQHGHSCISMRISGVGKQDGRRQQCPGKASLHVSARCQAVTIACDGGRFPAKRPRRFGNVSGWTSRCSCQSPGSFGTDLAQGPQGVASPAAARLDLSR